MPISLRRWKKKATQYINDHFRATGEGTLNHDLKMYLELPEFQPLFDGSVARINGGANEDEEIKTMIRELARSTLTTAIEVAEERGGGGSRSSSSSSSSSRSTPLHYGVPSSSRPNSKSKPKNTIQYVDDTVTHHDSDDEHLGNGIHHHYYL